MRSTSLRFQPAAASACGARGAHPLDRLAGTPRVRASGSTAARCQLPAAWDRCRSRRLHDDQLAADRRRCRARPGRWRPAHRPGRAAGRRRRPRRRRSARWSGRRGSSRVENASAAITSTRSAIPVAMRPAAVGQAVEKPAAHGRDVEGGDAAQAQTRGHRGRGRRAGGNPGSWSPAPRPGPACRPPTSARPCPPRPRGRRSPGPARPGGESRSRSGCRIQSSEVSSRAHSSALVTTRAGSQ